MASSLLTKFIQPVGAIFGSTGQSGPVASVLGDDTGFVDPWAQQSSGPRGFVQESVEWSPARESLATQIGAWQQREAQQAQQKAALTPQSYGSMGTSSLGGDWAMVDQWNSAIDAASRKYGVPANLIKAVMKLESGGDPRNFGRNGAGAIGPMQVVDTYWGNAGYDLYDPAQNIMAGAMVLRSMYDQYSQWAQLEGIDPWKAATYSYYAGNPYNLNARDLPSQGGSGMTTSDYGNQIWQSFEYLNGNGTGYGSGQGFGAGMEVLSVVQGGNVHDWGEWGAESSNGYYGYGSQYGMSGTQHTGLDIAAPEGAPMYAPMGGTVMCAGTGIGSGSDGGGCGAFNYVGNYAGATGPGQGAGRLEILLDNGAVLIYGHAKSSAVRVGDRVSGGTFIGQNGGMNSAHVHLEARVRDSSTPSGWRIVDPRQVLAGTSFHPTAARNAKMSGQASTVNSRFLDFVMGRR